MMRYTKIQFFIFLLCLAAATAACSDDGIVQPTDHGACTITVDSSPGITVLSRADNTDDENPEFYMGTTRFYFYTSNATNIAGICAKTVNINAYNSSINTLSLTDSEIEKIFGTTATECCVYAVSNLPGNVSIGSNPTISELKAIALSTDFVNSDVSSFVMDGIGTVTLDRDNSTMSGSVSLQRAAAKITLDLAIKEKIEVEGELYEPVIDDDHKIYATLYNCATSGAVDAVVQSPVRDSGSTYRRAYTANGTVAYDDETYDAYTHDAFYTYPASWSTDNDTDIHVSLAISWKKTDTKTNTVSYVTYNYQVPINIANKIIERNHHYKISLRVGVISGEVEGETSEIDAKGLSYEIAEWTNDGTVVNAILTRNHYLMVHDNSYSLIGQSKLSFQYQTCYEARAYLVSVCFNATRYDNQLVYLYNSTFDETTQTFAEVSDDEYSDLDKQLREKYASVPEYIAANYTPGESCTMLTNIAEYDTSSDNNVGTITFNADIESMASAVFRPLTFTIAIVNTPEHKSGRQLITITQYPSKYVEYGAAGNAFVNGYYSHLYADNSYTAPDDLPSGSLENGSNGYRSLHFTYNDYSTDGYYTSESDTWIGGSSIKIFGYPQTSNADNLTTTSYEYLQGSWTTWSETDFKYTIDVHVTAFSPNDHTYSYHTSSTNEETRSYKIGDPRIKGNYINDAHTSGTYAKGDQTIYDYYYAGRTRVDDTDGTTHYDRMVKPWPNVADIKIGGTSTEYDDVISPLYKIQSTYGNAKTGINFEIAQKRCATYQEAGYPAGRWRLPTLAEIAFIIHLQDKDVIERYFKSTSSSTTIRASTGGYWTSSGGKVIAPYEGVRDYIYYIPGYKDTNNANTYPAWVRCVYDLWLWGNEQSTPTHKFHPKPTK
jgi:hypothetical protein